MFHNKVGIVNTYNKSSNMNQTQLNLSNYAVKQATYLQNTFS